MSVQPLSREQLRTMDPQELREFQDWLRDPGARFLFGLLAGETAFTNELVWADDGDKEWPFLKGRRMEVEEIREMLTRVKTGELLAEGNDNG